MYQLNYTIYQTELTNKTYILLVQLSQQFMSYFYLFCWCTVRLKSQSNTDVLKPARMCMNT